MNSIFIVVVQSLSHVRLFVTPWTAACQASLSFTISRSLLKFMSVKLIMLSNHLILCHPLLLLFSVSQHQDLFQWVTSLHQVGKVLELQLQSFQWIFCSRSISFRIDWFDFLVVFSSTSIRKHRFSFLGTQPFFSPTLTSVHGYWKYHSFDYTDYTGQEKGINTIWCSEGS